MSYIFKLICVLIYKTLKAIIFVDIFIIIAAIALYCIMTIVNFLSSLRMKTHYNQHDNFYMCGNIFLPYCKLPKKRDLFQNNYLGVSFLSSVKIFDTQLPPLDMNDYDFDNFYLNGLKFHKKTKLPNDIEFFQRLKHKALVNCTMPEGDYSKYNFKNITFIGVKFPNKSILPQRYDFFTSLGGEHVIVDLPTSIHKNIHLYNLKGVSISCRKKIFISENQASIMCMKLNYNLPKFIEIKNKKKPAKLYSLHYNQNEVI